MRTVLLAAAFCALPLAATASTAPRSATFHDPTTGATCGIKGKPTSQDPVENRLKNRIEMPSSTVATTVAEFRTLPDHDKTARSNWTDQELQQFGALEAEAVRIQGYLIGVKQEGSESTNCGATDVDGIDFHMWLVDAVDADKDRSFSAVVEVTPRWRKANPAWSCSALYDLIDQGALFRVSGWRLYDYEHPEQTPERNSKNPTRSTLWEIHPITKIEVATDAGWLELGAPALDSANLVKVRDGDTYSGRCKK
jgi:hypothetical protein